MQVMIPKLQEITRMAHLDQQKGQVQQQQIGTTLDKSTLEMGQTVVQSNEDEKTNNEEDAKEQGNNTYYRDPREKKHSEQKQDEQNQQPRHKIDIKI
jgi:hypothetical protein